MLRLLQLCAIAAALAVPAPIFAQGNIVLTPEQRQTLQRAALCPQNVRKGARVPCPIDLCKTATPPNTCKEYLEIGRPRFLAFERIGETFFSLIRITTGSITRGGEGHAITTSQRVAQDGYLIIPHIDRRGAYYLFSDGADGEVRSYRTFPDADSPFKFSGGTDGLVFATVERSPSCAAGVQAMKDAIQEQFVRWLAANPRYSGPPAETQFYGDENQPFRLVKLQEDGRGLFSYRFEIRTPSRIGVPFFFAATRTFVFDLRIGLDGRDEARCYTDAEVAAMRPPTLPALAATPELRVSLGALRNLEYRDGTIWRTVNAVPPLGARPNRRFGEGKFVEVIGAFGP